MDLARDLLRGVGEEQAARIHYVIDVQQHFDLEQGFPAAERLDFPVAFLCREDGR